MQKNEHRWKQEEEAELLGKKKAKEELRRVECEGCYIFNCWL
jgi:hypothetical protein